jgi:hypothetical protein
VRNDERRILERAIKRVSEQAANANAIVDEAMAADSTARNPLTVQVKHLRSASKRTSSASLSARFLTVWRAETPFTTTSADSASAPGTSASGGAAPHAIGGANAVMPSRIQSEGRGLAGSHERLFTLCVELGFALPQMQK